MVCESFLFLFTPMPSSSQFVQVSKEEECLAAWSAKSLCCAYKTLNVLDIRVDTGRK